MTNLEFANLSNLDFAKQCLEWNLKQLAHAKYFVEINILSYNRTRVSVMIDRLRVWGWTDKFNADIYRKQYEKLNRIYDWFTKKIEEHQKKNEFMFDE